jgi:hypothetical protein
MTECAMLDEALVKLSDLQNGLQFFGLGMEKSESSPKHYDVIRATVTKSSVFWDTTP